MTAPKILIADSISQRGIDELSREGGLDITIKPGLSETELIEIIPEFSSIVVRSQTKVTANILKAGKSLRVVGRAGVGVDNVDVEVATQRGVLVLNAPGGNTVSTAEHTFSLLLSVARKIPQADAAVRGGKWDRKNLEGVELYNKTLGVIGMGRIGSELSRRAIAFGMRVIAYDPYLSATRARSLQVELVDELDDLLATSDFISLHTPLTPETRHILDAGRLQRTKRGVRIINCARGGLIDETALANALQDRHVAAAALDVFEIEPLPNDSPLRSAPNLVLTPHLGASTAEAQESVGIEIAQSVRAALLEGTIRNAVNMPNLDAKTLAIIGRHLRFGEKLGRFLSQIAPKRVDTLNVNYSGKVNEVDTTAIDYAFGGKRFFAGRWWHRRQRSERAGLRRKSRPESYGIAIERPRGLHRFTGTLCSCRRKNRLSGRRIFWGNASDREHQQPASGSAPARHHPCAGKHRPPRHGGTHRNLAWRPWGEYCHHVVESESGRRHCAYGVESRYCPGQGVAR